MEVESDPTLQTPLQKRYANLPYRQAVFTPRKEPPPTIDLATAMSQVLTLQDDQDNK